MPSKFSRDPASHYFAFIYRLRDPSSKRARWTEKAGPFSTRKEAARALIMRCEELGLSSEVFAKYILGLESGRHIDCRSGYWHIEIKEI